MNINKKTELTLKDEPIRAEAPERSELGGCGEDSRPERTAPSKEPARNQLAASERQVRGSSERLASGQGSHQVRAACTEREREREREPKRPQGIATKESEENAQRGAAVSREG